MNKCAKDILVRGGRTGIASTASTGRSEGTATCSEKRLGRDVLVQEKGSREKGSTYGLILLMAFLPRPRPRPRPPPPPRPRPGWTASPGAPIKNDAGRPDGFVRAGVAESELVAVLMAAKLYAPGAAAGAASSTCAA